MSAKPWRRQAMEFLAAYDRAEGDAYEQHMARLARRWLGLLRSRQVTQGLVNAVLEELAAPPPPGYGCGWDDLRRQFTAWAVEQEWLDPGHAATADGG